MDIFRTTHISKLPTSKTLFKETNEAISTVTEYRAEDSTGSVSTVIESSEATGGT